MAKSGTALLGCSVMVVLVLAPGAGCRARKGREGAAPAGPSASPGTSAGASTDNRGADMGQYKMLDSTAMGDATGAMLKAPVEAPASSEDYAHYEPNRMVPTVEDHLSTFAVDVDNASYTLARRKLLEGAAVPADAVRVEEFVNYFDYGYAGPKDGRPFTVHLEAAPSPFHPARQLLRVGVKGRVVERRARKQANLVFLVDVSGSMSTSDKLALAQRSLRILVDNLQGDDSVALVTYAGSTRVVLEPTGMGRRAEILAAIDDLSAGGSTAMGSGISLAYELAARTLTPSSVSRVIVLSDGDANVGSTTHEAILETIAGYVKRGVTLSTIGFGTGNYRDTLMEQLANKGNGNNYYVDSTAEAERIFGEQLGGTIEVIAQDVKLQVEFDPAVVSAYRLIGYENRAIADQDFRQDAVDAGEIGAGHSVTAMYELELTGKADPGPLAMVRVRAKPPGGDQASEATFRIDRAQLRASFADASASFRFATAVTAFAELLRKSPAADGWTYAKVLELARPVADQSGDPRQQEFVRLVESAMANHI